MNLTVGPGGSELFFHQYPKALIKGKKGHLFSLGKITGMRHHKRLTSFEDSEILVLDEPAGMVVGSNTRSGVVEDFYFR